MNKEQRLLAMTELGSYYLSYNSDTAEKSSKSEQEERLASLKDADFKNEAFGAGLKELVSSLHKLPAGQITIQECLKKFENFENQYNCDIYKRLIKNDFAAVAKTAAYLQPVIMILDSISDKNRNGPYIEIKSRLIDKTECMLLCHYLGNKTNCSEPDNISDYIESTYSKDFIDGIDSFSYLLLMSASVYFYRDVLNSKLSSGNNERYYNDRDIPELIEILSLDYATKRELTPSLSSFFNNLLCADAGIFRKIENVQNCRMYKMGGLIFKDFIFECASNIYKLSYTLNGHLRVVYIDSNCIEAISEYFLYTDYIALMYLMKMSGIYKDEPALSIVKRYNLLYFRSVNLNDDSYTSFLSLTNNEE